MDVEAVRGAEEVGVLLAFEVAAQSQEAQELVGDGALVDLGVCEGLGVYSVGGEPVEDGGGRRAGRGVGRISQAIRPPGMDFHYPQWGSAFWNVGMLE